MNSHDRRNEKRFETFLKGFKGINTTEDVEIAKGLLDKGKPFNEVISYFDRLQEELIAERKKLRGIMRMVDEEIEARFERERRLEYVK